MDENAKKVHQPSMSVDEQIENLRLKGLIINDVGYARSILEDISYFRLVKAYSLGLKAKNSNYDDNVRFEDIVQLYLFDSNFRQALFPQIEKIEINLRCRLSNYFSEKYGIFGYENSNNFSISDDVFQVFYHELEKEINRNSRKPFIKNFQESYDGGKVPFYALVEVMSFGTLSKFFKNMKREDKEEISLKYDVHYTYLESWLENLSYVRNVCAHYGRIYNAKMIKMPRLYRKYTKAGVANCRIFASLLIIRRLLPKDRSWDNFVQTIELLIEKYPHVKLHCLGFPKNWNDLLSCVDNYSVS